MSKYLVNPVSIKNFAKLFVSVSDLSYNVFFEKEWELMPEYSGAVFKYSKFSTAVSNLSDIYSNL